MKTKKDGAVDYSSISVRMKRTCLGNLQLDDGVLDRVEHRVGLVEYFGVSLLFFVLLLAKIFLFLLDQLDLVDQQLQVCICFGNFTIEVVLRRWLAWIPSLQKRQHFSLLLRELFVRYFFYIDAGMTKAYYRKISGSSSNIVLLEFPLIETAFKITTKKRISK